MAEAVGFRLDRGVPRDRQAAERRACDLVYLVQYSDGTLAGMLIVAENSKLMRPGIKRYFERRGYLYRGRTGRGLNLWLAPIELG